jgi:hypothetical protein
LYPVTGHISSLDFLANKTQVSGHTAVAHGMPQLGFCVPDLQRLGGITKGKRTRLPNFYITAEKVLKVLISITMRTRHCYIDCAAATPFCAAPHMMTVRLM